jgi:hypothetical protein
MIKKMTLCGVLVCAVVAGASSPAYAQRPAPALGRSQDVQLQTFNFLFGGFFPKGLESRTEGDVLVANLDPASPSAVLFDINAFKNVTFGGEWLLPVGRFIEVGAGISYYKKTVPSIYQYFSDSDGTEIDSDLSLRQVPLAFTVRVLPLGSRSAIQPYAGGGLGISFWKYSETGEFIDFSQGMAIFEDTFEESGTSVSPLFLVGARYVHGGFSVGGEFRWQWGEGDLSTDFAGSKIDLGGMTFQATVGARF